MSNNKTFNERYNEALPLFRAENYNAAFPLFQSLLPEAPDPKDRAKISANILACLRKLEHNDSAYWKQIAGDYAKTLHDPDAVNWPSQPAEQAFENLACALFEYDPQGSYAFLLDLYRSLPTAFCAAFEKGLATAFDQEARQYDRAGHEDRARQMGELYLELTASSNEHKGTRVAIRNRLADMLIFHASRANEDLERRAFMLLQESLQEQPDNRFARSLQEHIAQRNTFRLQIDRFWHDTHNRIAPMKTSLRRLQEAPLPKPLQDAVSDLDYNLGLIDTSLRLSGAAQGSSAVLQPSPQQYQDVDPVGVCRETLRQNHLDPEAVVFLGQPAPWEIAPSYLGLALHNLLVNSLEAYRRRSLPLPPQPVTLTIDYNLGTIRVSDAAGGISPHISDPFLPYVSEKGVQMTSGLGLLQARTAIQSMGGSLVLDPQQPNGGAAFLIQLPR